VTVKLTIFDVESVQNADISWSCSSCIDGWRQ